MKYTAGYDDADPILYRVYWSTMLEDVLRNLKTVSCKETKEMLHEFHKRILGYETIAGEDQETVSRFLSDVCLFWASEFGIFVRTSRNQPIGIENCPLSDVWSLL